MADVGRPLKFQSVEELQNLKNGEVFYSGTTFLFEDFYKEKDLVEYFIENIHILVKNYFDDEVVSFEVDKPIQQQLIRSPRGRRIDIFVQGKNKTYIIEAKNAKNTTELRSAIGQILDYGREFLDPKKELVILSNMFDINTAKTISFYNLPIRYIVLNKDRSLEYLCTQNSYD